MIEPMDLLYGSRAIAAFLNVRPRVAEHLIEQKRIPYFKIGRTVCARRSSVLAALEALEDGSRDAALERLEERE